MESHMPTGHFPVLQANRSGPCVELTGRLGKVLKDMLAWLNVEGGPKTIPDERASSGSKSNTSENAEKMRRARLRAVLAGDCAAVPRPKENA
jgi:hypothetical protein